MELFVNVSDRENDEEQIQKNTQILINQLQGFDIDYIEIPSSGGKPKHTKGDPITIGAIILGLSVASLPPVISFLQNWVGESRKVNIEAPNGAKIEFVPSKRYSTEEILELVKDLNKLTNIDSG